MAIDTHTKENLDIPLKNLAKHYDFFLPWAGLEKAQHHNENPADIKAAEKMAKLFDEIKKDNPDNSPEFTHGLNVFLSRLLFCFFAEDTSIFQENQFTNAIGSHTQQDGSDLNSYLDKLFTVLNTPEDKRRGLPEYLKAFPFVNGSLFEKQYKAPKFSRSSRAAILNSGDQDWSAINPDIFGSMFQAVIGAEQRGSLGQHYTSVPNIMKVMEPLFLNELYEEFKKAKNNKKKLNALLNRIHKLKIFDPACGSGNFLIIAYKELRLLEMKIFKAGNIMALSGIQLAQFYGIEIDDFAAEIAKLALWLAEHQMNVEFLKEFGKTNPTLPLSEAGHIVQGNATRLDWEEVCPKNKNDEIYILGNPPYLGGRMQNASQKEDLNFAYKNFGKAPKVDYIAAWFLKSASFIKNHNSKSAFVTTNSVCQGEQVSMIWKHIITNGQEIDFAHKGFKWQNNAKKNATVIVSIIGIRNISAKPKYLIDNNIRSIATNISPYLTNSKNTLVEKRNRSISKLPKMEYGNMAIDGGFLILNTQEKDKLISKNSKSNNFIRQIFGAEEYLNGVDRFCLWIKDENLNEALEISEIKERIGKVRNKRINGKDKSIIALAEKPHQFREMKEAQNFAIILPTVSSERREYLPIGFIERENVIIAPNQAIYDPEPYLFGILTSRMHMTWMRTVAGRLKTDYRYSSQLVYNTFPFPPISKQRKEEITRSVFRIIEEREKHPEKTMAQLYDPDEMPDGLREAHRLNDIIIEKCYRSTPFSSDEERLEYLFKLYEKMIAEEKNTLFAKEQKKSKTSRK